MTLRRGQVVTYSQPHILGRRVRAIVRGVHLDGTATIEARFEVDEDGHAQGAFLGYTYRVSQGILTP